MNSTLKPYARIVVNHSQKCNMHCTWCHEEGMQLTAKELLLAPAEITKYAGALHRLGTRKFKIVGGEPTLRNDLPEIVNGIRNLDESLDLSMVSNGSRLEHLVAKYKSAGLDRVNVSLLSLDVRYFETHVGHASLMGRVERGIDAAVALGMCSKLNHVYHDYEDLLRVLSFARERSLRVNVLNVIPSLSSPHGQPIADLVNILNRLPVLSVYEEEDPYSLPVRVMTLRDGTVIEVKHRELGQESKFVACETCKVKTICKEGIFAIRVTPKALLQPCIVREDNALDLRGVVEDDEIGAYLASL